MYCHKCGQEVRDQDIFCFHCGTKLQKKTTNKALWFEKLCLWGDENKISELCPPQTEESLLNITSLDISNKQLTEIPDDFFHLINIEILQISNNNLTKISSEISQLINLNSLDISSNQLDELPDEICKLKNLTELNLNYNNLTELPKDIGKLAQLQSLGITCPFLCNLPESIVKINKLGHLSHLESGLSGDWYPSASKYKNWIYELLKDECNISLSMGMGDGASDIMIDIKCSTDTWKNSPTHTLHSANYEIDCKYDSKSDKFLYFNKGIEVIFLSKTEEWIPSRESTSLENDTLISLITKTSTSDEGVFFDILDDILQYELNTSETSPLIEMAIAYTRRSCSAGMYTQGIHNKDDHSVYQDMWLDSIKSTGKANSKSFQTAAASQSFELIESYDSKLNKKLMSVITTTVEHGDLVSIADMGIQISVEEAISYFQEPANNMNEEAIGQQTINVNTGVSNENIFNTANSSLDNRPPLKLTPTAIFESKRSVEIFIEVESLMNSEDFQDAITANEAMISMSIAQAVALREMNELIAEGCEIMSITPGQFFQIVKDKKSDPESDDLLFDDEIPF